MSIDEAARSLGKHLKKRTERGPQLATVTGTEMLETRSVVECELLDGTPVNAIAWTGADLDEGTSVVLMPIQGKHKMQWTVVTANAPHRMERRKKKDHTGHRNGPFIPSLPKKKNAFKVIEQTQQIIDLPESRSTELRIRLRFTDTPNDQRVRYDLFLYHPHRFNFKKRPTMNDAACPGFIVRGIGTAKGDGWTWKGDGRYRTHIDLDDIHIGADSLGPIAMWEDWESMLAVLAIVRLADPSLEVRATQIGRLARMILTFAEPVTGQAWLETTTDCRATPQVVADPESALMSDASLIIAGGIDIKASIVFTDSFNINLDDELVTT